MQTSKLKKGTEAKEMDKLSVYLLSTLYIFTTLIIILSSAILPL